MDELIIKMNAVLDDWKKEFDVFSKVQLNLRVDNAGKVCLNDNIIHLPDGLSLASASFDAKSIRFCFDDTRKNLVIGIVWPEDETPYVNTIRFCYGSEM